MREQDGLPHYERLKRAGRERLPENLNRRPGLQALVLAGNARVSSVLDKVAGLMVDILNDFDRKMLPKGKDIRWRNTAMWERNTMREEGLISDNSPIGIWEVTSKGRRYLQDHQ